MIWKRSDLDSGKNIRVLNLGGSRKLKPKVPRSG